MSIKTTLALSTAFLLSASMGSVFADETDLTETSVQESTQARTQTRTQEHAELNLQDVDAEQAQSRIRERKMEQSGNQYSDSFQMQENNAGFNSMSRQGMMGHSMRGNR